MVLGATWCSGSESPPSEQIKTAGVPSRVSDTQYLWKCHINAIINPNLFTYRSLGISVSSSNKNESPLNFSVSLFSAGTMYFTHFKIVSFPFTHVVMPRTLGSLQQSLGVADIACRKNSSRNGKIFDDHIVSPEKLKLYKLNTSGCCKFMFCEFIE